MENNENENIISLRDDNGNEEEFEIIATLNVDGKDYAILLPVEREEELGYIFRIDRDENGEDILVPIENDDEFETVREEFENLNQEE